MMEKKYIELIRKKTSQNWKVYVLSRSKKNVFIDSNFLMTEIVCDSKAITSVLYHLNNPALDDLDYSFMNIDINRSLLFTGTLPTARFGAVSMESTLFNCFGDSISPFKLAKPYFIPKGSIVTLKGLGRSGFDELWYGLCGYPLNRYYDRVVESHFFVFNFDNNYKGSKFINVPKNMDYFVFNTLHISRLKLHIMGYYVESDEDLIINIGINRKDILQVHTSQRLLQGTKVYTRKFAPIYVPNGSLIECYVDTSGDSSTVTRYSVILGGYYKFK